ncbi:unnamed protein product [Ectocarpus sp. 4 AP-2014]
MHIRARPTVHTQSCWSVSCFHHLSLSLAWLGWPSQFRGDTISKSAGRPTHQGKRGSAAFSAAVCCAPLPPPLRHVAGNVKRRKLSLSVRCASCNPAAHQCGKHVRLKKNDGFLLVR